MGDHLASLRYEIGVVLLIAQPYDGIDGPAFILISLRIGRPGLGLTKLCRLAALGEGRQRSCRPRERPGRVFRVVLPVSQRLGETRP